MSDAHAARRERLRERCSAAGWDAALVTSPANLRWLTGLPGRGAAALLLTRERALLVLPEEEHAARRQWREEDDLRLLPVADGRDPAEPAAGQAAAARVDVLGVEEHDLTVARHRLVGAAAAPARLADLDRTVERLRVVKDADELACLRIAAEIADQALGELLESILVGRTERHLAMELERRMIDHGAEGAAFPVRVGAGPHAGLAGHVPGERRVEEGDFLTVALGACYHGYRASAERTFVVGTAPADWQAELHALVFAAQRAGREALLPGRGYREVDRAARQVLHAAGYAEPEPGPLGHGVGLEVAEEPHLGPAGTGKLDACVPVTVGQGVHLPGRGGVRIEDTLVVRPDEDGGPELLTITTKELLAL
jgi:Xaa-Pro aminopeptidase